MSGTDPALTLPWDSAKTSLLLTRETTREWPNIEPMFADGGYFPNGLTIDSAKRISSSANEVIVSGTTLIDFASLAVEAKFLGSGQHAELELTLTVTLAKLMGDSSPIKAAWQPKVTFKSNNGDRKIALDAASGTLRMGHFDLTATLAMSYPQVATGFDPGNQSRPASARLYMSMPGPQIVATLKPADQALSSITSLYDLEDVGADLALREIRLSADPWRGTYALELDAGGHWEILHRCKLTEIAALVVYASEARSAWATLRAAVTLGGIPLQVKAAFDPSVSGWQFDGGMAPEQPLEIAGFIDSLLKQLGAEGKCPELLSGATINELATSFNTSTQAVIVRCEISLPLRNGKALNITLLIHVEGGRTHLHGTVTLGSLEFDLVFDEADSGRMLVASYSDPMPLQVKLGDVLAMVLNDQDPNDQSTVKLANKLSFSIKDALFLYEHRDNTPATWLLAADVEAGMDFSGFPLIGASVPAGQGARLLFQPLITSGGVDAAALSDLVHVGGLRLPEPLPDKEGFSVTTKVALGTEELKLGLPVHMSDGKMVHAPDIASDDASPGLTRVDDISWIAVQRAFGPLALERLGIRYDSGALDLLLDAHLSAAGLTLALEGFGAHVKLADPSQVMPILDGIGLDFRSSGIEIGGSLMHQKVGTGADAFDEYVGSAIVKAGALSIDAMGAYRIVDGHPSLFVYAALDYPIGGPAFFFVTGLAAAFGYNRSFKLPPIEKLTGFPLLSADAGSRDVGSADALRAASDALREHIPAEIGAVFLGVGLKFSSFQTVASSALLTASFGRELALDLIGRSTLIMPAGATRQHAVAVVEMAWLASYRPADGILALRSQLSPGSYVFSSDCHLAGGFAFYSWFSGDHAGEFVLTAGGYHPGLDLANRPHFPRVPRLAVAWQVNDALSIKGDAYYALTTSAAMAGGHLEMVWEQYPYKAWCKAGIDCLFEWQPLHYIGEAYVELGASYTFELAGTRHITIEAGADLTVWGPPFSGRALVNLVLFSFEMSFGTAAAKPPPVHLLDDDGKGNGSGFSALLPEVGKRCAVSVTGGLSRYDEGRKLWVVNPKALRLTVDCVIPAKQIHVEGMTRHRQDQTKDEPSRFGIAPMAVGYDEVRSETTITLTKVGDSAWRPEHLAYRLRTNRFPSALWGEPKPATPSGKPSDEELIEALAGVEITPMGVPDTGTQVTWRGIDLYERHRPALRDGTYDIHVTHHLSARAAAGDHRGDCCKPLEATATLRFEVAGEEFNLPGSCIHSVFPPRGSLSDHSTALPQIILERSTLPWERAADVDGADENTPWLALLVFDGEKKATAGLPQDGLPGPARITVDATEIPSSRELKLLCHVRVARSGVERAVVVANRTPTVGKLSTVHLVSLRGIETDGAQCRLVSLSSWSFSCPARGESFSSLMQDVEKAPFARTGVCLGYSTVSGKRAVADYRGPLVPIGDAGNGFESPDRPDISQLAALELGRLLALQNKPVSVGLLRLKRARAHDALNASQLKAAEHLYPPKMPMATILPPAKGSLLPPRLRQLLTPELAVWVEGLLKLEGVPVRYFLPDEALLPKESLRSFALDERWLTNLLLGALSVGGPWRLAEQEKQALPEFEAAFRVGRGPVGTGERPFGTLPTLAGVVLRSQLVSGWPAMAVFADGNREPLVCRRLSKNILLVLFTGTIKTIAFRLPQETLHLEMVGGLAPSDKWLDDATSSVQLGRHLRFATQEEIACEL